MDEAKWSESSEFSGLSVDFQSISRKTIGEGSVDPPVLWAGVVPFSDGLLVLGCRQIVGGRSSAANPLDVGWAVEHGLADKLRQRWSPGGFWGAAKSGLVGMCEKCITAPAV